MILDTSFILDLCADEPDAVAKARQIDAREEPVYIPTPVLYELWEGVARSERPRAEAAKVASSNAPRMAANPFSYSGPSSGSIARPVASNCALAAAKSVAARVGFPWPRATRPNQISSYGARYRSPRLYAISRLSRSSGS